MAAKTTEGKRSLSKNAGNPTAPSRAFSSPKANPDFRENPDRAIHVAGAITPELVRRLTPEIRRLRHAGPTEPITVYIDSEGGSVQSCEHLEGMLFNSDQDGNRCRIITVATALAASAAARLLTRGDCALAYANATIHCHGTRFQGITELTRERADLASRSLSAFNDEMASAFMHRTLENLPWLYQFYKEEIDKRNQDPAIKALSHMQGLACLIQQRLSVQNRRLMDGVFAELNLFTALEVFLGKPARSKPLEKARKRGRGAFEFRLLKLIVDFLESECPKDEIQGGLKTINVAQLTDLYSLRKDYYERFLSDCDNPEPQLLMLCETEQIVKCQSLPENERKPFLIAQVGDRLFSAWQLATTLSANLVRGENPLSARDAYWLGLVEEVVGDSNLPCRRTLMERV